ncbi:cytochrome P450 [Ramaria rubella]|nr:cytochrome P450 [Ramaria rubella]
MTLSNVPPGVHYLSQILPKLALPLLSVSILHRYSLLDLSQYVWGLIYLLILPAVVTLKNILRYLLEEHEIRRLGARRVPQVRTYWPGGVDLMLDIYKRFVNGSVGEAWENYCGTYGSTCNVRIFWKDTIVTTEPNNLKIILATEFDNYEKGRKFKWQMKSVLGTGIFNSDDDMWKFHRDMARPYFSRTRVTEFDLFDRHAEVVITKLKERFVEGEAVDFQDIMSRFTLDTATLFLFGSSAQSLSAPLPYALTSPKSLKQPSHHDSDTFSKAFSSVQYHIALRGLYNKSWPLLELWKDGTKENMKVIYDFIDPILERAVEKRGDEDQGDTLLDHLVEATDDHALLRDEILNVMIAGRDTTMATLTFVVYCLAQHPDVLLKLRCEIMTKIGARRELTVEDVKACKYMRAVINETLRLFPPVPLNTRHSKRSMAWPASDGGKPYYIPAGVDVQYSVWSMHRRVDLWGPDAQEFDPDRFLDDRVTKYLIPNPFIFMPFNSGPRICLGQQFAYNETTVMLVRLLQTFDTITFAPDAQSKVWPKSHLTLYSCNGLWLRMREAKSAEGDT